MIDLEAEVAVYLTQWLGETSRAAFCERAATDFGLDPVIIEQRRIGQAFSIGETRGGRMYWEPYDDLGVAVLAVPVADAAETVDILALVPDDPAWWAVRTGHAAMLGAWPDNPNAAVRVYEHPIDWLRHERPAYPLPDVPDLSGVCVLDRAALAPDLIAGRQLIADSAAHKARLKVAIDAERRKWAPPKRPKISFQREKVSV